MWFGFLWVSSHSLLHSAQGTCVCTPVCLYRFLVFFSLLSFFLFFFFQAEDGIRDIGVTGVQTCALPISSANGDVDKFYFFPKAAGSYRFPNALGEGSDFKLRAAYGETGNQPLFGQKFTTLQGGQVIGGHVGTVVGNGAGDASIRPERTREIEAGIDASLLRGRASVELTLFQRRTSDLLVPVTPAPSMGYGLQFLNGGKIKNEGIEVAAGLTLIQREHVNWIFRTTFTSIKNWVLELNLPGGAQGFRPANAGY